jgi:hypothetical protein
MKFGQGMWDLVSFLEALLNSSLWVQPDNDLNDFNAKPLYS